MSETICLAKWFYFTLNLPTGKTQSCFHPRPHSIDFDRVDIDKSKLHNTEEKKIERQQMLNGEKPPGCSYCWNIEKSSSIEHSDRFKFNNESWAKKGLELHKDLNDTMNAKPTYLEIITTHNCNLACSYCAPNISSSLQDEFKKYGSYFMFTMPLNYRPTQYNIVKKDLKEKTLDSLKAWWPEIHDSLQVLKLTGGEPLADKTIFDILDLIDLNPNPNLELEIISNLSYSSALLMKFLKKTDNLYKQQKLKKLTFFCSLDNIDQKAELIRGNLNFKNFNTNINELLEHDYITVSIIHTFTLFSLFSLKPFFEYIFKLEDKFNKKIHIDLPPLTLPSFLSIDIFNADDIKKYNINQVEHSQELILERSNNSKFDYKNEMMCLERISNTLNNKKHKDTSDLKSSLYIFLEQYTVRKGFNLNQAFPELNVFLADCKKDFEKSKELLESVYELIGVKVREKNSFIKVLDNPNVTSFQYDFDGRYANTDLELFFKHREKFPEMSRYLKKALIILKLTLEKNTEYKVELAFYLNADALKISYQGSNFILNEYSFAIDTKSKNLLLTNIYFSL
jgi:organic radical activating enzyme